MLRLIKYFARVIYYLLVLGRLPEFKCAHVWEEVNEVQQYGESSNVCFYYTEHYFKCKRCGKKSEVPGIETEPMSAPRK